MNKFSKYTEECCVIIFTETDRLISSYPQKRYLADFFKDRGVSECKLAVIDKNANVHAIIKDKIEEILIIIYPEEKTQGLKILIDKIKIKRIIMVAIHLDALSEIKDEERKIADIFAEYVHELGENNPIWNSFSNICVAIIENDRNKFEKEYINLVEELKKRDIIKHFFLLKHRIAHLWVSLDIDLQGIKKVSGEKKCLYLTDILKDKKDKNKNYYKQKLVNYWNAILNNGFELKGIKQDEEGINLIRSLYKTGQKKSVLDIINIEKDRGKEELIKYWTKLLELSGIEYDKKDPFNKDKIKTRDQSQIKDFLSCLDELSEKNEIMESDVNDLIEKEEEYFKEIESFHKWFEEISNAFDQLRGCLDEKERTIR
jgi:hypothetical protein